jgi:alpha-galactosidase
MPEDGFQGEGLLAVVLDGRPVHVWAATEPAGSIASVRVRAEPDRLIVSANGPVGSQTYDAPDGLAGALTGWADDLAARAGVIDISAIPPVWCSWYCYWAKVSEADVIANLGAMDRLRLPVAVVQIDDGYEAEIGDWLIPSDRFTSLVELAARIRDRGRRAGIWVAPFLVGARSRLANDHPEWMVRDAWAGHNWNEDLYTLDVTHPDAAEYLANVFRSLAADGFTYFKLDFIYAGALPGGRHDDVAPLDAYREGLRLIRDAVGPDATLLGCGAPIIPSVGLVDAMRISPDVAPFYHREGLGADRPSMHNALVTGRARAFQHGRLWANDPDCLIVRPEIERREEWAAYVEACSGVVASSDPLEALDDWGLEVTRRLLRPSSTTPVGWWDPHRGPLPPPAGQRQRSRHE